MLKTLAAADKLPDELVFRNRIENLNFSVALQRTGRSLGRRKDCIEWFQSSEDGASMFVALVHWMDKTLVCEELLPISSQLSPPHGFLFHE